MTFYYKFMDGHWWVMQGDKQIRQVTDKREIEIAEQIGEKCN